MSKNYQQSQAVAAPAPDTTLEPQTATSNAEVQETAGLGADPASAGGAGTASLVDAIAVLWDARVDGVDEVWSRAAKGGPPDASVDLLVGMVSAAVGLCTGSLAQAVASKRLSSFAQSLIKATLSPLEKRVSGRVTGVTTDAIRGALSGGQPPADGYFLGMKAALRADSLDAMACFRAAGAGLEEGGEAEAVEVLTSGVLQQMFSAEAKQMQTAVTEWMSTLACAETGRLGSEEGTDLSKAGSGRSLRDKLFGDGVLDGVVHLTLSFDDPNRTPAVTRGRVSGIPKDLLTVLAATPKQPLADYHLPVFLAGATDGGSIELGRNERGTDSCRTTGNAENWLHAHAIFKGCAPEAVAAQVLSDIENMPFGELPLELV